MSLCRCQFSSTQSWYDYSCVLLRRQRRHTWVILITSFLLIVVSSFFVKSHCLYGVFGFSFGLACYTLARKLPEASKELSVVKYLSDHVEAARNNASAKVRLLLENDRQRNLFDWLSEVTSNQTKTQVIIWTLTGLFAANPSGNFWDHIETVRRIMNVAATKPEEAS